MFGTWLWLGLALEIWDRAFLYSIPLYILVFAVYYSVSVFVGILYRRCDFVRRVDGNILGDLFSGWPGLRTPRYQNGKR